MSNWLRTVFHGRPWWMNVLMVFSAYMVFIYVPWDFFVKDVARDQEVWFGIMLTGWAAKATEPLHWAIYAAGAYGFRRMRPWMSPWAAVYVAQIALGTFVWNITAIGGVMGWVFGVVSAAALSALAWALWRARPLFQRPPASLRERYGEWAVVTGASAGIGAEFARALAREGIHCVLAARRGERLRFVAAELEKAHSVSTRVVEVDLADPAGADRLADAVEDLEIGLLVNNAGVGYAGRFDKQDPERARAMVQLNCVAPVVLTSRLLPAMRERGRGAVIVVGSVAGHQPVPLHAVYSASKAFDLFFGESLWAELQGTGVDALVLEPGPTATEFQDAADEIEHPGEPPERVVEVALSALGLQPSVISGWMNWLRGNASRLLPRALVAHIARDTMARWTPPAMR